MTVRTDITVDFAISPRIITVASPSVAVSVQDLHDTLVRIEDSILPGDNEGPNNPGLIESAGKEDLGSGVTVGITATLQDAQIAFQARVTELESGTITTPDTGGITLEDSAATFQTNLVARGDLVSNRTDSSQASVISVTSETVLVCDGLVGGSDNQFDSADVYEVFDVVQCNISGGNLVAVDTADLEIDPVFPTFGTQIVRTSSSSATLQELEDIQHAAFEGAVQVDVLNGSPGTAYPAGNTANPVDNLTDAAAINVVRGFDRYDIIKSLTLTNVASWQDSVFVGHSIIDTVINVNANANVTKAEFLTCSLEGSLGDTTILRDCFLGETNVLSDVRGVIEDCSIGPAKVTLGGTLPSVVRFVDCRGAGLDLAPPTINCNGDGPEVDIQGYVGQLNIENKTGQANFEISIDGKLTLDATMTAGIVVVNGSGTLVDNSGPGCTVVDNMIHGQHVSEIYISKGLELGNPMTNAPGARTSADGTISQFVNQQQSLMNYGESVTEIVTRLPDPALTFNVPLISDLVDTIAAATATFARASDGTHIDRLSALVVTASSNVARFEVAGILIEESRINICLQARDLSTTWTLINAALVDTDVAVSPDGATTADRLKDSNAGGTGTMIVQQAITTTISTVYSAFIDAKKDGLDFIRLDIPAMGALVVSAFYDLTNGTIGATKGADNTSEFMNSLDSNWFQSGMVFLSDVADTSAFIRVTIAEADNDVVVDLDDTSSNFLWHGQFEAGLFPTSRINTLAIPVTRSADFLSYEDDTVVLDAAGSIFAEITPLFTATDANNAVLLNIADQLVGPLYILDDTTQKVAIGDGTNVAKLDPTFVRGQTFKVAVRWSTALNQIQVIVNGVASATSSYDGAFTRTAGTLYIGSDSTGNHFNGNIRNVKVYNSDLGEAQLKIDTG